MTLNETETMAMELVDSNKTIDACTGLIKRNVDCGTILPSFPTLTRNDIKVLTDFIKNTVTEHKIASVPLDKVNWLEIVKLVWNMSDVEKGSTY